MEFDNIKSSAALIYDEFIQNAGEFSNTLSIQVDATACLQFKTLYCRHVHFNPVDLTNPSTCLCYRLADGELVPYVVSSAPNNHHRSVHLLCHVAGASDNGEPQRL